MANEIVNGIPTAYHFKYTLGRTGMQGAFKRHNVVVDDIYDTLKRAETFRTLLSMPAVDRLRAVRVNCYSAINGWDNGLTELEEDKIKKLKGALDQRIVDIATHLLGAHKQHNIETLNNRLEFEGFYDNVAMNGRTVGRTLGNDYRYERAASRHFGEGTINDWLNSGAQLSLNSWVDTVRRWAKEDGETLDRDGTPPAGVQYLDHAGRQAYRVYFTGGLARHDNGDLYHTGNLTSSNAGDGWGIFVVDFNGNFYLGSHRKDHFHHSSFFSGAPVKAGGEIAITGGRVVGITNKTGHYRARAEELDATLALLGLKYRVNLNNVRVNDPFNRPGDWFMAVDALKVNGQLQNLAANKIVEKPPRIQA